MIAAAFRAGFPDLRFSAEDMIAEGDEVIQRLVFTGTHRGEFMNMPPTGRQITVTVVEVFRLADGQIVEQWVEADNLGALQQLGVIPPMGEGGN